MGARRIYARTRARTSAARRDELPAQNAKARRIARANQGLERRSCAPSSISWVRRNCGTPNGATGNGFTGAITRLWMILDPVVSVHPDATIFEVFSQDESSYGRVTVAADNLQTDGETVFGTTNVDFSAALGRRDSARAFLSSGKIKRRRRRRFALAPTRARAFGKENRFAAFSWVRGFLQVQSASTLPGIDLTLSASTVAELLMILRRDREKESPRSLRFELENGAKPKIVLEPWNIEIAEHTHVYNGESTSVRVWGRRRLFSIESLLAYSETVQVRLLGTGMPHFWSVESGGHRFDVGLSGWTKNDWSSAARFDLAGGDFAGNRRRHRAGARAIGERFEADAASALAAFGFGARNRDGGFAADLPRWRRDVRSDWRILPLAQTAAAGRAGAGGRARSESRTGAAHRGGGRREMEGRRRRERFRFARGS